LLARGGLQGVVALPVPMAWLLIEICVLVAVYGAAGSAIDGVELRL
jgi:hypothetical protein